MPGAKEVKRRIKSVKNTKKITKAMELVAASKMKKAVTKTLASRLYAEYSWQLLKEASESLKDLRHSAFLGHKKADRFLFVLITSNRGLCGGYNSKAIKKLLTSYQEVSDKEKVDVVVVGRKGSVAMNRVGFNVVASFTELPESLELKDIIPVSKFINEEYKSGKYKEIKVVYTDYVSALVQKPQIRKVLPVSKEELKETLDSVSSEITEKKRVAKAKYIFEGDKGELVNQLATKLTRMQIYQMLLESNASEQSARMISMKNAGEAAGEMIDDLTLVFNKARQAGITREISEISAGMASISG